MYYAIETSMGSKIFDTWDECVAYRDLAPSNARYKKFKEKVDAEAFLSTKPGITTTGSSKSAGKGAVKAIAPESRTPTISPWVCPDIVAYTDGSYNKDTGIWGYGVIVCDEEGHELTTWSGNGSAYANSRNVTGEIYGVVRAVEGAIQNKCKSIVIRYDYEGISKWISGEWKAKTELTVWYRNRIMKMMNNIAITFEKVTAHTGVGGNERADSLAKTACFGAVWDV